MAAWPRSKLRPRLPSYSPEQEDQSQFYHHFKRLVGVTQRLYRKPSRIAQKAATLAKRPGGRLSTIQSRPRRESPSLASEIAGRLGGFGSGSFESPPARSTLLSGLTEADQPPVALSLSGPGRPAS